MNDCERCEAIASDWPTSETEVTCTACGALLTRQAVAAPLPAPRARRWTIADLELLARWEGELYGRGAPPPRVMVQTSGRDDSGKQDEKTGEWHRACEVSRRFEAMRSGEGRMHYAVLRWLVFDRGMRASDPTVAAKTAERRTNKLMEELGRAFSPLAQQKAWASHKETALRDRLPRVFGQRLYDAAVKAWEGG
jgi:hypothetical protein